MGLSGKKACIVQCGYAYMGSWVERWAGLEAPPPPPPCIVQCGYAYMGSWVERWAGLEAAPPPPPVLCNVDTHTWEVGLKGGRGWRRRPLYCAMWICVRGVGLEGGRQLEALPPVLCNVDICAWGDGGGVEWGKGSSLCIVQCRYVWLEEIEWEEGPTPCIARHGYTYRGGTS